MRWLALIVLAGLAALCFIAVQILMHWPSRELRERSRLGHDRSAGRLYQLSAFGPSAEIFLWLIGSAALATLFSILFRHLGYYASLIFMAVTGLALVWRPGRRQQGLNWLVAGWLAGSLAYLLSFIKPVTESLNRLSNRWSPASPPADIYQKSDLLQLLKAQPDQPNNRIPGKDLQRAAQALTFNDKVIGQIMRPLREITLVEAGEAAGPAIMDELHKTGQQRFPVVKSAKAKPPEILGSLYIGDLLNRLDEGLKIRDLMRPRAAYINEANDLDHALATMLDSGCLLLLAVNDHGELVGALTAEDLINQAIGDLPSDDSADYDDPRQAAAHRPSQPSD